MKFQSGIWVSIMVAVLILTLASLALAEDKDPLIIDADWISYDSETGNFVAQGNVQAKQQQMSLQADNLEGNMNTKDVHAQGNVFWQKENDTLRGNEMFYNYNTMVGFLEKGEACVDGRVLKADWLAKETDKITAEKAWLSRCDAETVKCYEITAKKLLIYPGEKLIAYDASFWIRGKKIFTLKKYTKTLKKKKPNSDLPTIGYSSEKGFFANYKYYLDLDERTGIDSFLAFDYYSKMGTHLRYQADKDSEKEHWDLIVGKSLDKDNKELESLPSLTWQRKSQEIANTSLSYNYGAAIGYFRQNHLEAATWRSQVNIGLTNKPINLWEKANLNLWSSYEDNRYGNDEKMGVWSYGAGISQNLGNKGGLWLNYVHRRISGKTPFNFDNPGTANELNSGLSYQLDDNWHLQIGTIYNLDTHKFTDVDYYLTRKLHCFEARIMWKEKKKEFNWSIDLVNF